MEGEWRIEGEGENGGRERERMIGLRRARKKEIGEKTDNWRRGKKKIRERE